MKTVATLCILSASVASIKLGDEVEDAFLEHLTGDWDSMTSLAPHGGKWISNVNVPIEHDPVDLFYRNFENISSENCDLVVYEPSEDGEIVRFH